MEVETLNKLCSEVLMLSEAERAELAYALVKSLDAPIDVDVLEAWANVGTCAARTGRCKTASR